MVLTGTHAGSNALSGNLQRVTAERLGRPPFLMAPANTTGGVMGRMIDARSIAVAGASTVRVGNEAAIFRALPRHSLALVGLVVAAYATRLPWCVPRRRAIEDPSGARLRRLDRHVERPGHAEDTRVRVDPRGASSHLDNTPARRVVLQDGTGRVAEGDDDRVAQLIEGSDDVHEFWDALNAAGLVSRQPIRQS